MSAKTWKAHCAAAGAFDELYLLANGQWYHYAGKGDHGYFSDRITTLNEPYTAEQALVWFIRWRHPIPGELTRELSPAQLTGKSTNANDTSNDAEKKTRKSPKRGPRGSAEFMRFKSKMHKAEQRGMSKLDAALDFTHGDAKKARSLLRKFYRHKDLPG